MASDRWERLPKRLVAETKQEIMELAVVKMLVLSGKCGDIAAYMHAATLPSGFVLK